MIRKLVIALLACLTLPVAARAAVSTESFGPRVGFSSDPGQLLFGGQMTIGDIAPNIVFTPNAEIGVGDQQTNVYLDMDFDYRFTVQGTEWVPYAGLGMGIDFQSVDHSGPVRDASTTFVGGSAIIGASVPTKSGSKFFGEIRLGLGDMPSLKALVGWNFSSGR